MTISAQSTTVAVGQTGHAALHNGANTAINSLINRVQDAMTGATDAARFVGASAGSPVTGTFLLGDFIYDTTNLCFRSCTAAGTPGTWSNPISPVTTTNPVALGAVAVGTAVTSARQDHVHPTTGLAVLSTYTTKGDIISATGSGAVQRNAVGTDGFVLQAAAGQAGGLAWGHPGKPRAITVTQVANVYAINADAIDIAVFSAPAAASTISAPTGTPGNGQKLTIRILSGATGYIMTWNAAFISSGVAALPTTTLPASKTVTANFIYDSTNSKWVLMAYDGVGY